MTRLRPQRVLQTLKDLSLFLLGEELVDGERTRVPEGCRFKSAFRDFGSGNSNQIKLFVRTTESYDSIYHIPLRHEGYRRVFAHPARSPHGRLTIIRVD